MEGMSQRINEYLQSKIALFFGWLTSAGLVADGVDKKVSTKSESAELFFLSLADWQIIVGILFTLTMMLPKWYQFYRWLKKRKRGDE